ncbi:MAG: hypothetical protein SGILL_002536 [Bacillariaceae sp.]
MSNCNDIVSSSPVESMEKTGEVSSSEAFETKTPSDANENTATVDSTTSAVSVSDEEEEDETTGLSPVKDNLEDEDRVFHEARKIVAKRFEGSEFGYQLDSLALFGIPRFSKNELALGKRLGKGSFSNVDAVRGIMLLQSSCSTLPTTGSGSIRPGSSRSIPPRLDRPVFPEPSTKMTTSRASTTGLPAALKKIPRPMLGVKRQDTVAANNQESRVFMEQHCFRHSGAPRYAIKMVRRDVFQNKENEKNTVAGVCDLAIETVFLSSLEHPNIIKLRAIADMEHPFASDYFLVLDRLTETLFKRIHHTWRLKEKQLYNVWGRIRDRRGHKRLDFFEHRLERAYDLGSAIGYLHSKKIIHRDLKPDNIGFDVRDDIKLFDFGMARELKDDLKADEENYRLSLCGSPRYMAPEVWQRLPYNSACDVYSFGVVFYEMIALTRAFDDCEASDSQELATQVVSNDVRPDLDLIRAPPSIMGLFPTLWHPNAHYRCDMASANLCMRKELILLRRGDESRLPDFTRRRSTYIFNQRGSKNRDGSSSFAESANSILSAPLKKEHKRSSVANMGSFDMSALSVDHSSKSMADKST